jgi:energy-coupling factor transport system permease protein
MMLANGPILLGQYRPVDSFLHRLDARAKMPPILLVLVLALLADSVTFYLATLAALVLGLIGSGVGGLTLVRNFRPIFVLVFITALYHLIFTARDTEAVVTVWGLSLTAGGVEAAVFFSLRLVLFISVAFLVTLTNSPSELAEALARLLKPLRRVGLPVNDLALILFIAIRFIPVLYQEFAAIRNAQMMRGVDFSGSLVSRLRKTTAIIIPVFVAAIGRADDLAVAIEARGYRSDRQRTNYGQVTFGRAEWLFMLLASAGVVFLFAVT